MRGVYTIAAAITKVHSKYSKFGEFINHSILINKIITEYENKNGNTASKITCT